MHLGFAINQPVVDSNYQLIFSFLVELLALRELDVMHCSHTIGYFIGCTNRTIVNHLFQGCNSLLTCIFRVVCIANRLKIPSRRIDFADKSWWRRAATGTSEDFPARLSIHLPESLHNCMYQLGGSLNLYDVSCYMMFHVMVSLINHCVVTAIAIADT